MEYLQLHRQRRFGVSHAHRRRRQRGRQRGEEKLAVVGQYQLCGQKLRCIRGAAAGRGVLALHDASREMTQQGNDSMALIARIRRATCMHGLSPGELSLAMSLVGLDIVARVAPHAPNVTPIAASAVFAGMVLRSRALALAVPIAALLLSDLVAGSYDWRIMGVVYAALALPALLARWGRARPVVVLAPLVLSSSLLFFATTNLAVWAFSGMYAHDLHG